MRKGLSFDQIFPIRDPASALLMRMKADCLLQASAIEPEDRSLVYAMAAAMLGSGQSSHASASAVIAHAPQQNASGLTLSA
jgi:hypothetical protein